MYNVGVLNYKIISEVKMDPIYFNVDEALGRMMGNKMILVKLLNKFVESTDIAPLKADLEKKDYPAAAEKTHAIKGVSANLALTELNSLAKILEQNLKEQNGADYDKNFADLADVFEKTMVAIKEAISELSA